MVRGFIFDALNRDGDTAHSAADSAATMATVAAAAAAAAAADHHSRPHAHPSNKSSTHVAMLVSEKPIRSPC